MVGSGSGTGSDQKVRIQIRNTTGRKEVFFIFSQQMACLPSQQRYRELIWSTIIIIICVCTIVQMYTAIGAVFVIIDHAYV